jgi:hypothetical protein
MGKKKKRLQMQKLTDEKFVRESLESAVQFGLLDQIGFDEKGEPLYMMPDDIEARLELVRKNLNMEPRFSE